MATEKPKLYPLPSRLADEGTCKPQDIRLSLPTDRFTQIKIK